MKLYKFKDLSDENKHSHFYQIVLDGKIWCARPDSFNDENEFKINLDFTPSSITAELLAQVVAKFRTTNYFPPNLSASYVVANKKLEEIATPIINEMIQKCRDEIGVVSFSITKSDDHLWDEYGGAGNGACIEINIPDEKIGKSYHHVHYVSEKIFHVDSFLESVLNKEKEFENFKNILLTKTKKWCQEREMRFIGNRQDVNLIMDGYISEITFGAKVPSHTLEQVEAKIINHCSSNSIKIIKLANTTLHRTPNSRRL